MLAKSETVTRLIFDERWGGADAVSILNQMRIVLLNTYQDEESLVREREEALEQARLEREREELARREAEERARREAEEAAQREAEERAKQEAAAALAAKAPAKGRGAGIVSSGVRGVRGTRATATAMASRGTRGLSRTGTQRYPFLRSKFTGDYQRPHPRLPFPAQGQLVPLATLVTVEVGPGQVLLQAGVQVCRGVFRREVRRSQHPRTRQDSFSSPIDCAELCSGYTAQLTQS